MFHSNKQSPRPVPRVEQPRSQGGAPTVIGPGARIEGSIHITGSVRIDGEIEGGAVVVGDSLSVGSKGTIKGDLTAKQAIISGTVVGKIRARERVELLAGAHVRGDVYAQSFKIEDGVFFHGTCVMGEAAASEIEAATPNMRVIEGGTKGAKEGGPAAGAAATSSSAGRHGAGASPGASSGGGGAPPASQPSSAQGEKQRVAV